MSSHVCHSRPSCFSESPDALERACSRLPVCVLVRSSRRSRVTAKTQQINTDFLDRGFICTNKRFLPRASRFPPYMLLFRVHTCRFPPGVSLPALPSSRALKRTLTNTDHTAWIHKGLAEDHSDSPRHGRNGCNGKAHDRAVSLSSPLPAHVKK